MTTDTRETIPETSQAARPARPGRNETCHCGSGKKYKKCHLEQDEAEERKLHQSASAQAALEAGAAKKETSPAHDKSFRSKLVPPAANKSAYHKSMHNRKTGSS